MKVCVFGAGAVGSHIAARLCAANADTVSVVARGAHLAAIRERGITLRYFESGREVTGRPAAATDDPATLPPQDVVLVTLKATALPAAAHALSRLLAPQGWAVFLNNGIPWWWPYGLSGNRGPLRLLDPDGALWNPLRQRTLGCVVNSPNDLIAPGLVVHNGRCRFLLGEPAGTLSGRLAETVEVFRRGGIEAIPFADLRREIWNKLLLNASGNTLGALARCTPIDVGADPDLRPLAAAVMRETLEVAAALGWDLRGEIDVDELVQRKERMPGIRVSMLQDLDNRRPMEIDALLGQTQAFAREHGVPVPAIDVVLPLLRGLQRSLLRS